jgi:hypothetical protein
MTMGLWKKSFLASLFVAAASFALAQPPERPREGGNSPREGKGDRPKGARPEEKGPGAPGGRGGFGGGAAGGPGFPGGIMRPPMVKPGTILPPPIVEMLKLSEGQKEQLAELQKEVDARLAKILTEDQMKKLKEGNGRMPFGPGGPGGNPMGPRDGERPREGRPDTGRPGNDRRPPEGERRPPEGERRPPEAK